MTQVCQVTGKRPIRGMNVSHSHIRTLRRLVPNLHRKRYWVATENRFVTLRLSCHGMKIVDKRGIESVLAELRARGEKI